MLAQVRQCTPEEYLLLERRAEYKSEYVDGVIYTMAVASPNLNLIIGNVITALLKSYPKAPPRMIAVGSFSGINRSNRWKSMS